MQKYIQIYCNYFDYKTELDVICEACGNPASDVHHINGRGEGKDTIKNLMALCRKHHELAHSSKEYVSKSEFQLMHNSFLLGYRKIYLH